MSYFNSFALEFIFVKTEIAEWNDELYHLYHPFLSIMKSHLKRKCLIKLEYFPSGIVWVLYNEADLWEAVQQREEGGPKIWMLRARCQLYQLYELGQVGQPFYASVFSILNKKSIPGFIWESTELIDAKYYVNVLSAL